ncbi:hypothetical protein [Bradyrhizobium sp. ORS 86]|uniref:hypothetical protein n=1 Tax=Bradyrhizobium sp. ORS 86 TaxID=1685970 RepID=UPI00388DB023
MGFHRQIQPDAATALRAQTARALQRLIPLAEIARLEAEASDPFGIECCPVNRSGPHQMTASCGHVVCVHCARIFG